MDDEPLRVAHVLWRLSRGGGVQTVVRQLAANVDPATIELHVLSARPRLADDRIDELPVRFHALVDGRGRRSSRWLQRVSIMTAAVRAVRQLRPDVVHLHSGTAWMGFAASIAARKTPFVLEVHDAPGSGRHSRLTDRVEGWWARLRRAVVVVHSTSVEREVHRRWNISAHRLVRFPLAVDLLVFEPDPDTGFDRSLLGVSLDQFMVIGVGRLVRSKRFDLAIEALRRIRSGGIDGMLVLVGSGPEEHQLRQRVEGSGLTNAVVFAGPRYGRELVGVLRCSDALVSTSAYEGFGLTLVEAMAASLPTVAMSVGGVVDIVDDDVTGYLVADGDVATMAQHLRSLADDPALRRRLGTAGRARAEHAFSTDALVRNFTDLYCSCMTDEPRAEWGRHGG